MAANCRAFGDARSLSFLFGPLGVRRPGEHVGHTPSLILKVHTLWLGGLAGKRLSHLGQQSWQGLSSKHTTGLFGS
jgi:hypothetical protein